MNKTTLIHDAIPVLGVLGLSLVVGCTEQEDGAGTSTSIVDAWNLTSVEYDGEEEAYPYVYEENGCTYTSETALEIEADHTGTLIMKEEVTCDFADLTETEEYSIPVEVEDLGGGKFLIEVEDFVVLDCALQSNELTCEERSVDDGVEVFIFTRA